MKTNNIATLLIEGLKTVSVTFNDGNSRNYTYKTLMDLEVGDKVVVNTPQGGLQVVDIIEVHKIPKIDTDSAINYKWIVDKVDTDKYNTILERERKFSDHLLELQQKSLRDNAAKLLAEEMGIDFQVLEQAKLILNDDDVEIEDTVEDEKVIVEDKDQTVEGESKCQ